MKNHITDEMVTEAFNHINNRAHPSYGTFKESQLDNPYGRAAFASAIKELYNIEMSDVPTLEEINQLREKNLISVDVLLERFRKEFATIDSTMSVWDVFSWLKGQPEFK